MTNCCVLESAKRTAGLCTITMRSMGALVLFAISRSSFALEHHASIVKDEPQCSAKNSLEGAPLHQLDHCFSERERSSYEVEPKSPPVGVSTEAAAATAAERDLISSFAKSPNAGQHLMLVPRQSPFVIMLDDDVAYRLRERQQLHSAGKDDLMAVPPWERRRRGKEPPVSRENFSIQKKNETMRPHDLGAHDGKSPHQYETVPLFLKSHPGQAVVPLMDKPVSGGFMFGKQGTYIELGIGREQDAVRIQLRPVEAESSTGESNLSDRRYHIRSENGSVLIVSSPTSADGAPITLTSFSGVDAVDDVIASVRFEPCLFVVNKDGSVSPLDAPDMMIGISPFPAVTLVPRNSPHRLLVRQSEQFWSSPAPVNGTPLELTSHPGLAVVRSGSRYDIAEGFAAMQELGVGPGRDAIRLFSIDHGKHHQFLLSDSDGMSLASFNLQLDRGVQVRLIKYHLRDNVTDSTVMAAAFLSELVKATGNTTWIVNPDGSISPSKALYLALGCEYVPGGPVEQHLVPANQDTILAQQQTSAGQTAGESGEVAAILTPDLLQFAHMAAHSDTVYQLAALLIVMMVVLLVRLVSFPIWIAIFVHLWFGSTAGYVFAGIAFTGKRLRRWWKGKDRAPETVPR